MRAVWSFWSKPFDIFMGRIWREPRHHLLAWGLSLKLARPHFAETQLVTDTPGKMLLVDRLGLRFDSVSTELDQLRDAEHGWWALGKLLAYSIQDRPFVHLDTDVFLWKALPMSLTSAPVFAQCPERHSLEHAWCGPRDMERLFERHGLPLSPEWIWAQSRGGDWFRAENCGILGANRVDFIRYYANLALRMVFNPTHRPMWAELHEKSGFVPLIEQFLLSVCLDYHRSHPESPFRGIGIRYLFPSFGGAYDPQAAARAGYTHLLGDAKTHPGVMSRLERRVAEIDPAFLRHCNRLAERSMAVGA